MTHEEFIQWLDREIEFSEELKKMYTSQSVGWNRATDGIAIFKKVKEKFLTLTPFYGPNK